MSYIHRNHAGELMVSDISVSDLAREFGTPLYVYSGDGFVAHYRSFLSGVGRTGCRGALRGESQFFNGNSGIAGQT